MENFEERLRKYKVELRNSSEAWLVIKKTFKGDDLDAILSPKDERQLKYAEAVVLTVKDAIDLVLRRISNEINPTPVEENEAVKLIVNEIKALLNGEKYDSTEEYKSMAKQARLYYGRATLGLNDYSEYVIENTGADERNKRHVKIFQDYFDSRDTDKEAELPVLHSSYTTISDEEIDGYVEYANELHTLCEKYKKLLIDDFMDLLFGKRK